MSVGMEWQCGAGVRACRGRRLPSETSSACSSLTREDSQLGRIIVENDSPVDEKVESSTPVTRAPAAGRRE